MLPVFFCMHDMEADDVFGIAKRIPVVEVDSSPEAVPRSLYAFKLVERTESTIVVSGFETEKIKMVRLPKTSMTSSGLWSQGEDRFRRQIVRVVA